MRRHRILTLFLFVIVTSATIKFYLLTKNNYNYYGLQYFDGHRIQQNDSIFFANELLPIFSQDVKTKLDKEVYDLTYYRGGTQSLLNRMDQWFPKICPILRKYNIPDDFKYLVVVESGLKNVASHKNAKGFWQFRKATAQANGLTVNEYLDERYNPFASTIAACKYLKKLRHHLNSWVNVCAAYNMGLTGLKRQQVSQRKKSYFQLKLNKETGHYVYKIVALKILDKHRKKYRYKYKKITNLPEYNMVTVDSTMTNLHQTANYFKTNADTIRKLNPWILTDSIPKLLIDYNLIIPKRLEDTALEKKSRTKLKSSINN